MALEGFAPEEKITAADVVEALKENTTSTGIPHIHHARGRLALSLGGGWTLDMGPFTLRIAWGNVK